MTVDTRVRKIPAQTLTETWYIASDGREFRSEKQCQEWEQWLKLQEHPVFKTCITGVRTRDDEPAVLYNIRNEEDYQVLMSSFRESQRHQIETDNHWGKYGPGWYMYFYCDGGDGPDLYYMWNWNSYLQETEEEFNKWKIDLETKMARAVNNK